MKALNTKPENTKAVAPYYNIMMCESAEGLIDTKLWIESVDLTADNQYHVFAHYYKNGNEVVQRYVTETQEERDLVMSVVNRFFRQRRQIYDQNTREIRWLERGE